MTIKSNYFTIKNGELKNKKITFNPTYNIKPTKNNIKSIFLTHIKHYQKLYTLDLFAGTGILSFDILSINKHKHILIEKENNTYINLIKQKQLLMSNNDLKIHNKDSYLWLKLFTFLNISLTIIDPPYVTQNIVLCFSLLNKIKFLKKYMLVFFENNKKIILKNNFINYFLLNKYKKGNTLFYLIKKI